MMEGLVGNLLLLLLSILMVIR